MCRRENIKGVMWAFCLLPNRGGDKEMRASIPYLSFSNRVAFASKRMGWAMNESLAGWLGTRSNQRSDGEKVKMSLSPYSSATHNTHTNSIAHMPLSLSPALI